MRDLADAIAIVNWKSVHGLRHDSPEGVMSDGRGREEYSNNQYD
jgi:hypothetical protein